MAKHQLIATNVNVVKCLITINLKKALGQFQDLSKADRQDTEQ